MDLRNSVLDTLYEGSDPKQYSQFSAKNINKPYTQLLENDVALLAEAERVKVLTTASKNQNVDNDRDLSSYLTKVSALEILDSPDERLKVEDLKIPAPLNVNGFLIGGLTRGPVGYSGAGNCVVTAVSAYTKGFQGSYLGSSPADAATTKDAATVTNKFFYGAWNTGPRTFKGGLSGGWHTPLRYWNTGDDTWVNTPSKEGCLLRLHKASGGRKTFANGCVVTMEQYCNTREVRFRAYVWIDSGPTNFKFGPMYSRGTISVPNLKEWVAVDVVIDTKGSTGKYWKIILDTGAEQTIYIAMLGIYPIRGSGDTSSSVNVE